MPVKKPSASVAIDTVPTPDMKQVPARVTKSRDAYFLTIKGKKQQIPLGPLTLPSDLEPLVGQSVTAVLSSRRKGEIVAIGTWPTPERPRIRPRQVLCYVPAEATLRRVRDVYREAILRELVAERAIPVALADAFRR